MTRSIVSPGAGPVPAGPAAANIDAEAANWRAELAELIARLASDLVYQPAGDIRSALIGALGAIVGFLPADRAYLYRTTADRRQLVITHEAFGPGIGPLVAESRTVRLEDAPAVAATLRGGDVVELDQFDEPAGAAGRRLLGSDRVRAAILLPLRVQGRLIGLVRIDALRAAPWPPAAGRLLRPFRDICANAIAAQNAIAGLEASELRHRSVLDEITDVVVRIGPQGNLTYINRAWQELTGNPVADTVGLDPLANVHPEDRALAVEHMTAAIAGRPGVREVRFLTHDGGLRWMEVRGRALFDGDGNGIGFSGVMHDVTARKEADLRVRAARDEAERARDEAEQAREDAERALDETEQARDAAERARVEAEQARGEAERARVEAEQARGEAEQARDEAERASRAKSEFLSRMSHELRTPLNAILGFSQLLEFADLRSEEEDNLTMISSAGRHLLNLINDVMDVSRIESGRLAMSLEPVAVADVVAESVNLIRPAADARKITVQLPDGERGGYLTADRQRLTQVLVNLLSNAVKYNREGGQVRIAWRALSALPDPTGGWLRIEVTDTGPGIRAERLEDVFVPFERLGAQGTDVEGTGIGLTITKSLVEAMGGRIGVRSAPGAGSTFHIDLPLRELAGAHPAAEPTADGDGDGVLHTVLYIEDNPSNVTLMSRIFGRRPAVRLLAAGDAPTGLAMARQLRPDLILLDLHLPGREDGGQVLTALRADVDPWLREVPVVMVTADLTGGTERRLQAAGATAFLSKPVDIGTLLDTVDHHLPSL